MTNPSQPIRILLADDEDIIRTGLARWLRKANKFEVDAVENGSQVLAAVERVSSDHYAVVLLDQSFETGPTGLEVLSQLRDLRPELPVILFTGKEPQVGTQARELGVFSCLLKPLSNDKLIATIRRALEKQDSRLGQLCELAAEILEVPLCFVWLLNEARNRFEIRAWHGPLSEGYRQNVALGYRDTTIQRFLQSRSPFAISNVTKTKHYNHIPEARDQQWRSLLTAPMISQGRVVGILDAYTIGKTRRFKKSDRKFIQAFADQAATLVDEGQLFQKSQALAKISKQLASTYDVDSVLDTILDQVLHLVGTHIGWIYLSDVEHDEFTLRAWRGLEPLTTEPSLESATCVEPIILGNQSGSEVVAQLKYEHAVMGKLVVKSEFPNAFSKDDIATLQDFAAQAAIAIERDKLNRHIWRLGRLIGSDDWERLLDYIVGAVHDLTGLPVALWRVDERNNTKATIQAFRKIDPQYARDRLLDLKNSLVGEAIRTSKPLEVVDILDDRRVSSETRQEADKQGWKSLLIVPILAGSGRAFGTLSVYTSTQRSFTPREHGLLSTLVRQAEVTLQNAERLRLIRGLSESGRRLTSVQIASEVLERKLRQIASEAKDLLEADLVDLYQYDADTKDFVLPPVTVGERRRPDFVTSRTSLTQDDVIWQIVRSQEPHYATDAQSDPVLISAGQVGTVVRRLPRFVAREKIVSAAAIPLKVVEDNQQILAGILFVSYRTRREFTEVGLKDRIETFAGQAAVAIQNAKLFDLERKQRERAETLRETAQLVNSTRSLEDAVNAMLDQLRKVIEYDTASVQIIQGDRRSLVGGRGFDTQSSSQRLQRNISEDALVQELIQRRRPIVFGVIPPQPPDARWEVTEETEHVKSWMGVPLIARDQVIGLLTLDHTRPGYYTDESGELVAAFAHQAASAIYNNIQTQALTELAELTRQFISIKESRLDTQSLLSLVATGALKVLKADVVEFYEYQEATQQLVIPPVTSGTRYHPEVHKTEIRADDVLLQLSARNMPRYMPDSQTDEIFAQPFATDRPKNWPSQRFVVRERIKSTVFLPLKAGNETVGYMFVSYRTPQSFEPEQRRLIELFAGQAAAAVNNSRLNDSAEKKSEQIEQLYRILDKAMQTRDLQQVGPLLVRSVATLLGSRASAVINEFDPISQRFTSYNAFGPAKAQLEQGLPRTDNGVSISVIRDGKPLFYADASTYPFNRPGVKSFACLPLSLDQKVLGTLYIRFDEELHFFSKDERSILQMFADGAAAAFQNARLIYQELQRLVQLQTITANIFEESSSDEGSKQVLIRIASQIAATFGAHYCTIRSYDTDRQQLGEPILSTGAETLHSLHVPRPNGLSEYVIRNKQPVFAEDPSARLPNGEFVIRPENQAKGTNAVACLPLLHEGLVIGRLAVSWNNPRHFSENDKNMLRLFASQTAVSMQIASQASVVLHNAHVWEAMQKLSEDLSAGALEDV